MSHFVGSFKIFGHFYIHMNQTQGLHSPSFSARWMLAGMELRRQAARDIDSLWWCWCLRSRSQLVSLLLSSYTQGGPIPSAGPLISCLEIDFRLALFLVQRQTWAKKSQWNLAVRSVAGEVVFCTAMMGYPESLTDPSFAGSRIFFLREICVKLEANISHMLRDHLARDARLQNKR